MKKLAEKAKNIQLPPSPAQDPVSTGATSTAPGGPAPGRRAFTGVGDMMGALGRNSPLGRELEEVKARLREYDGALPVRLLDPTRVAASRWVNRHETEFDTADFARLKTEIEAAGVNVQPIKVRPVKGLADRDYEIVFGHRRHRACLELGVPVLALVEDLDESTLYVQMERENRERRDLSPWEQGVSYQRALDAGLFTSLRKLAEAIGADPSNVSKYLKLAQLPQTVVDAFASPLEIQQAWAAPLAEALQRDPQGVLDRARALKAQGERLAGKEVFQRLVGQGAAAAKASPQALAEDGQGPLALWYRTPQGGARIEVDGRALSGKRAEQLQKLIVKFLGQGG